MRFVVGTVLAVFFCLSCSKKYYHHEQTYPFPGDTPSNLTPSKNEPKRAANILSIRYHFEKSQKADCPRVVIFEFQMGKDYQGPENVIVVQRIRIKPKSFEMDDRFQIDDYEVDPTMKPVDICVKPDERYIFHFYLFDAQREFIVHSYEWFDVNAE